MDIQCNSSDSTFDLSVAVFFHFSKSQIYLFAFLVSVTQQNNNISPSEAHAEFIQRVIVIFSSVFI